MPTLHERPGDENAAKADVDISYRKAAGPPPSRQLESLPDLSLRGPVTGPAPPFKRALFLKSGCLAQIRFDVFTSASKRRFVRGS
jgi:hypothetical protein